MKSFLKSVLTTAIGVIVGTLFAFILIPTVFMLIFKSAQMGQIHSVKPNSILHLKIEGAISERHLPLDFDFSSAGFFSEEKIIGLYEVTKAIEKAKADDRIVGLYLEIGNFSAGWGTVNALRRSIKDFADGGKWVYAYSESYDEMSYFLATAASQIFIPPQGDLELNGLAVNGMFFRGLLEKLELQPQIFRVGKFKAAVEPLTRDQMSEENRQQTQGVVNDLWSIIREEIAKSSKIDAVKIDEMAAGLQIVTADDAKRVGLVTETLYLDVIEERMRSFTVGKDNELELVTPGEFLHDSRTLASLNSGKKKVAVIFAEGEIISGEGGRNAIGSESLRQDILDAKSDEDVGAIVLRVNSPGGSALASDVIWREIRATDDEIPVVVSMGDIAASGGYYLAAGGRYIFAEPTTLTGSIGVFGVLMNAEKLLRNKAGVNFDRVVSHPYADIGSFSRALAPQESSVIQKQVEHVYKRFLDVVYEGRGYQKREDLETIAEGRVWSGLKAKELGLVDEIGGLDKAIIKAAEFAGLGSDYGVDLYPQPKEPFEELLKRLSGSVVESWIGKSNASKINEFVKTLDVNLKNGVYSRLLFDLEIR